jgi:hypothetical protein
MIVPVDDNPLHRAAARWVHGLPLPWALAMVGRVAAQRAYTASTTPTPLHTAWCAHIPCTQYCVKPHHASTCTHTLRNRHSASYRRGGQAHILGTVCALCGSARGRTGKGLKSQRRIDGNVSGKGAAGVRLAARAERVRMKALCYVSTNASKSVRCSIGSPHSPHGPVTRYVCWLLCGRCTPSTCFHFAPLWVRSPTPPPPLPYPLPVECSLSTTKSKSAWHPWPTGPWRPWRCCTTCRPRPAQRPSLHSPPGATRRSSTSCTPTGT